LEQAGLVLRHRSIDMTAYYAKADVALLKQIAQPWPEVIDDQGHWKPTSPCDVQPASLSAPQSISCAVLPSFATPQKQTHIRTATVIQWAGQARSVAQRHVRYQTVRLFAQYLHVEDSRHESPPTNYFGYRKARRVPHIYSCDEIERLVLAAKRLPSFNSLRARNLCNAYQPIAATGLRISEALHLLVSDITPDGLLIRKTKFQKTRLVPLPDTVVDSARSLLDASPRHEEWWRPCFCFRRRATARLLESSQCVPDAAEIGRNQTLPRRWPRIHELRHYLCSSRTGVVANWPATNRTAHVGLGYLPGARQYQLYLLVPGNHT